MTLHSLWLRTTCIFRSYVWSKVGAADLISLIAGMRTVRLSQLEALSNYSSLPNVKIGSINKFLRSQFHTMTECENITVSRLNKWRSTWCMCEIDFLIMRKELNMLITPWLEAHFFRLSIRKFNFTDQDVKDKWTAYRFTKNVYTLNSCMTILIDSGRPSTLYRQT